MLIRRKLPPLPTIPHQNKALSSWYQYKEPSKGILNLGSVDQRGTNLPLAPATPPSAEINPPKPPWSCVFLIYGWWDIQRDPDPFLPSLIWEWAWDRSIFISSTSKLNPCQFFVIIMIAIAAMRRGLPSSWMAVQPLLHFMHLPDPHWGSHMGGFPLLLG